MSKEDTEARLTSYEERIQQLTKENATLKEKAEKEIKEMEINQMVERVLREANAVNSHHMVGIFRSEHLVKIDEDGTAKIYKHHQDVGADIQTGQTLKEAVETWLTETYPEYQGDHQKQKRRSPLTDEEKDDLFIQNMTQEQFRNLSPQEQERITAKMRDGFKSGKYKGDLGVDM